MNNYSNQQNRQRNTDNNIKKVHTTTPPNQTVNRTLDLDNANNYYYDQQTNIPFNTRLNQQNHIPAPTSKNLRSLDSPSQTPGRRSRAQLEENDEFITVTNRSKKRRNDNNNDRNFYDHQQQQQQSVRPRYSIRLQNRQQQQQQLGASGNYKVSSSTENHHNHQSVQQGQNITAAATRYALTRFPFSPFIV